MEMKSLEDMYIAELQELASAERQFAECLPRVAKVASHRALKGVLLDHQKETKTQIERLESILELHGASPEMHIDQAMQALVYETEKTLPMLKGHAVRDAGLIASVQRLKHYEIATYGTVAALAGELQFGDDEKLLHESLEEEKRADISLTMLAKSQVNPDALAA
jgi:ferritin-like metal-binding protein YciE